MHRWSFDDEGRVLGLYGAEEGELYIPNYPDVVGLSCQNGMETLKLSKPYIGRSGQKARCALGASVSDPHAH